MRSEKEIKELKGKLLKAVNVDDLNEYDRVAGDKDFLYLCNVIDALDWVLGEIDTDSLESDAYLNLQRLQQKAKGEK